MMEFVLSTEAENTLDVLEHGDPTNFELVVTDLEMLAQLGIDGISLGAMFGGWARMTGPTGRVAYWVMADDQDRWLIESIDVD
jgi:hypothetical protein